MKVMLFGASGMVGQGVLRAALQADDVTEVLAVGRGPSGLQHAKLRDLVLPDLFGFAAAQPLPTGYDACFFCLGVSSGGMAEADYQRLTYDLTLAIATALAPANPGMTFIYVSGAGTDSSEQGRTMWARVKGRTENALLRLPFKAVYLMRPGMIQPLDGIQSKTPAYRWMYRVIGPLLTPLRRLLPRHILTTRSVGQAMLAAARQGAPSAVLETADIQALAARG